MPRRQLGAMLTRELGAEWPQRFLSFELQPMAAASIGQVHRAVLRDGTAVVVKVQYPGVAESIDADLDNLRRLVKTFNVFPEGYVMNLSQYSHQ